MLEGAQSEDAPILECDYSDFSPANVSVDEDSIVADLMNEFTLLKNIQTR